jgi:multidrug efflux pump subunit AcrB
VPLLAARLLTEKDAHKEEHGSITRLFHAMYSLVMRPLMIQPWLVLLLIVPLVAGGYYCYQHTGQDFMPKMDEGGFVLDYTAPPGMSLAETDRLLKQVEVILRGTPEVETYSRRTGLQLGGGITEANEGDFFVRLKPMPRRGIEKVIDEVRDKVQKGVPGLDIELKQLMEDVIGDLTASVPEDIAVELFSDDGKLLSSLAPKVADAIKKIPGVVDVKDGLHIAGDALDIQINRVQAGLEGLDPEAVTKILTSYLEGDVTTHVQRGPKMVGVRLWVAPEVRRRQDSIGQLQLRAPDGHMLPLSRIATITPITGQPQITRNDLKRMVAVTGRIADRDMGSTMRDVKALLSQTGLLPAGVYYRLGGMYEQQQNAFKDLMVVLIAAVVLVFLLLLFLYERFRVALAMLATTLLSAAAVFIGLYLTGTEQNITSRMGLTMIMGIVTEVGIFYFSEYRDLAEGEAPGDRFILAGLNRMRPIAMTTLAAILALMPLALGGQGSSMERPLAIAIISGLVAQMPLALMVLPALLRIVRAK